jgi:thiamine biosynthesis protein ThiI
MSEATKKVMLVKYGEISLRKGNRAYFEHQLMDALRARLASFAGVAVRREQGRFLIEAKDGDLPDEILPRIQNMFGLLGFCHAIKTTARDIKTLREIAVKFFTQQSALSSPGTGGSSPATGGFKVQTKRSDKKYPLTSTEISASIGEEIHLRLGTPVDLHNPAITLHVEIRNDVYFYVDAVRGVGGLPYGASGRGVLLLSGGFDSPVAGYLAARRGVALTAMYFHSPPFVSERARDKVADLAGALAAFTGKMELLTVPFTDIQVFLKDTVPLEKLTILMKRAMLRLADKQAEREKALCLVTGDAIGQVASQTVHSLAAVNSATRLPILRPLAAMDKQDIIDIARRIGTHDISIRPYDDCCTLFLAKHPENKPNTAAIEKIENRLLPRLEPLLDAALEAAEVSYV